MPTKPGRAVNKRIVHALELRERGQFDWRPVVSGVRRASVVEHRKKLLSDGTFMPDELRIEQYGPLRSGGVDK